MSLVTSKLWYTASSFNLLARRGSHWKNTIPCVRGATMSSSIVHSQRESALYHQRHENLYNTFWIACAKERNKENLTTRHLIAYALTNSTHDAAIWLSVYQHAAQSVFDAPRTKLAIEFERQRCHGWSEFASTDDISPSTPHNLCSSI